jgi:hypothetical protein
VECASTEGKRGESKKKEMMNRRRRIKLEKGMKNKTQKERGGGRKGGRGALHKQNTGACGAEWGRENGGEGYSHGGR